MRATIAILLWAVVWPGAAETAPAVTAPVSTSSEPAPAIAGLPGADRAMLLPLQDRPGDADLARFVTEALEIQLGRRLRLASTEGLRDELRRLRLRDASDIDPADLRRLAETFRVEWLISATLHLAWEKPEPQFTISAWCHRVEDDTLAWAGYESASGLGSVRTFGRGRIEILEELATLAVERLVNDLERGLDGEAASIEAGLGADDGFLLEPLTPDQLGTVAVLPFESVTRAVPGQWAELVTALGHATLHRAGATLLHPGRVNAILRRRGAVSRGGLDPLSRAALRIGGDADHIFTGTVETYEAPATLEPNPHVAFSARLVDVDSGRILWINGQERTGWERPGFFGLGKFHDAGSLAETMMQTLVTDFLVLSAR